MLKDFEINRVTDTESLELHEEWLALLLKSGNPTAVYASPEWVEHLSVTNRGTIMIWSVRDQNGTLCGLVPILLRPYCLNFGVYNRVFFKVNFKIAEILGSAPMLPKDPTVVSALFTSIMAEMENCDGIYMDALFNDSPLTGWLQQDLTPRSKFCIFQPFGERRAHMLELSSTFDAYLKTFSAKTRSTLKRKARILEKRVGSLEFSRIEFSNEVLNFLKQAEEIGRHTWQYDVLGERISTAPEYIRSYTDLADRGLLRCYLLQAAGKPCAFMVGYQYGDVFQSAELGFDAKLSRFSPGTVLMYLLIEDLHVHRPVRLLNFGVGDATYKMRFGNVSATDRSWLVMRRNIRNRMITSGHKTLDGSVRFIKRIIGRMVEK